MKSKGYKYLIEGITLIAAFGIWTMLIMLIDVQNLGVNGTEIGFARLNLWFHSFTDVNMVLYSITDWLGLVPVFICMIFGTVGLVQLIRRKSLMKVDADIIILGLYYIAVISGYLLFEMIPINYRPVLINGFMEASYPSSTTLLVLSVMPTLTFQADRRIRKDMLKRFIKIFSWAFSFFMVISRLVSGVHWLTDIVASVLISGGLFFIYKGVIMLYDKKKRNE